MQHCRQLAGSIPFPEEPDTLDHNNTTVVMKHAGKEKAGTKRCVVLLLTHKYNYTAFGYAQSPYIRSAHCGSRVAHGSSVGEATGLLQLSVPTYRIFSNLIRTSSCRFLKRKKKKFSVLVRTFPSTTRCQQGRLIQLWVMTASLMNNKL